MNTHRTQLTFIFFLFLSCNLNLALGQDLDQKFDYRGEFAAMATQIQDQEEGLWSVRYLPEVKYKETLTQDWTFDLALAAYLFSLDAPEVEATEDAEIFRAWGRIYNDTLEIKIGLQELTFGPAVYLRSLQWFDTKNPLDPTSFTKGVKSILLRFSSSDNSTGWLWGLYGNEELFSLTSLASDTDRFEFGGRAEISIRDSEWAITAHQRFVVDDSNQSLKEARLGLDFKMDFMYNGLWFEAFSLQREGVISQERLGTLGLDYTLDIFSGVLLLLEKNWGDATTNNEEQSTTSQNSLFMAQVGQGLLDSYTFTALTNHRAKSDMLRLDWQRTYDDLLWSINFSQQTSETLPSVLAMGLTVQYNH